jgi:hypothetical protein
MIDEENLEINALSNLLNESNNMIGTSAYNNNNNNNNNNSNKVFKGINNALNDILNNFENTDPLVAHKTNWINEQLIIIDEKKRSISLNYVEVKEAIDEAAKKATLTLQNLTKTKLETITSVEMELRRELEQINWLDFVKLKQLKKLSNDILNDIDLNLPASEESYLKKVDFLKFWENHTKFRNNICRYKPTEFLSILPTIQNDIKIQDDLNIYIDPFFRSSTNNQNNFSIQNNSDNNDDNNNNKKNIAHFSSSQQKTNTFLKYTQQAATTTRDDYTNYSFSKPYFSSLATATTTNEPIISPTLQNTINNEMDAIEEAIANVMQNNQNNNNMPLPQSIIRPTISGERYSIPLHSILDGLEGDSFGVARDVVHNVVDIDDNLTNNDDDNNADNNGDNIDNNNNNNNGGGIGGRDRGDFDAEREVTQSLQDLAAKEVFETILKNNIGGNNNQTNINPIYSPTQQGFFKLLFFIFYSIFYFFV